MNACGRLTFPPRGVFIPTSIIFNRILPPKVLFTWIQLRTMAWDGGTISKISMDELAKITGKNKMTLQRHLSQLKTLQALSWRLTQQGSVIISFTDHKPDHPSNPTQATHCTVQQELPHTAAYFPERILGYISYADEHEDNSSLEFP